MKPFPCESADDDYSVTARLFLQSFAIAFIEGTGAGCEAPELCGVPSVQSNGLGRTRRLLLDARCGTDAPFVHTQLEPSCNDAALQLSAAQTTSRVSLNALHFCRFGPSPPSPCRSREVSAQGRRLPQFFL